MFLAMLLLVAAQPPRLPPADSQSPNPREMMDQISRQNPEDEELAMIRAADQHPLGTLDNPIRVGGPEGEHAYLGRLRCPDGSTPRIGPRAEGGVGAYGSVTGAYDVACGGVSSHLVFDIYHEEFAEDRAPPGFTLAR
jgi:hypothetical protein